MEEEIITPEEEVFNYNKLRYILDKSGYVCHASLGALIICDLGECTEYNGDIPNGYSSIEEWYDGEIEKLNAWKIVEGNLVFDNAKYAELQEKCKQQELDNLCVTHKELYGLQKEVEDIQDINNSQYTEASSSGKLITINNVKKVYPKLKLTNIDCYLFDKVDVVVTGKNMLPNNSYSLELSGIQFEQNEDKSITINGTSTEDIEYNIAGTSINTSPFLCFKKDVSYYLSSNDLQIKMYYYDGIDKDEVYGGTGGVIKFTDNDKLITHVTLFIPKGTEIKNTTIYPQLEKGTSKTDYEMYKSNVMTIDFSEYVEEGLFPSNDLFPSDDLFPCGTTIKYILIENGKAIINVNDKDIETECNQVHLFDGYNTIYTLQDTYININYCINNLKLEGVVTKNNNFKVLEDGSIEAHNGYFSGVINAKDGNFTGEVNAKGGTIGGYSIGETSLYANIKDKYTYTLDDYERARKITYGEIAPTQEDFDKLDLNKDGEINSSDFVRILRKYYGYESTEGKISINTEDANNIIVFEGNTDNIHTSIGMNKITTDILTTRTINTESLSIGGYEQPKIITGSSLPETADDNTIFLLYEE